MSSDRNLQSMSLTASTMQAVSPPPEPTTVPGPDVPEFEIRARRGWVAIDFNEVFHYRELLYFLTWRDVKIRYKQTVLGFAWAIIQPVINVIIQSLIFGVLFNMKDRLPAELRHIPYAL